MPESPSEPVHKPSGRLGRNPDREARNARALQTGHLQERVGQRAARGGMIALSAQFTRFAIQIGSTAVLSRLLSPADYGTFAMAATVTIFLSNFTDLGLSAATIQREKLSQTIASTLWTANLIAGGGLAVLLCLMSPLVAHLYNQPELTPVLCALSATYFINAAGSQQTAILARQMRWRLLQGIPTAAQAIGALAAIASAAFTDWGLWAFVIQGLVSGVVVTLGVDIASGWRPTLPLDFRAARREMAFGGHVMANGMITYLERQTDNILIGARWGPTELGYYSRAYNLLVLPIMMINIAVSSAAVPMLSRVAAEPERWNRLFLQALTGTSYIAIGVSVTMAVSADPIVRIVLGPQWSAVVPLFQILSLSAMIMIAGNNCNWAFLSLGESKAYFKWALISAPPQILSFFIGLPYGAAGVATAYAIAVALVVPFYFLYTSRHAPVRMRQFFLWLLPVFVAAGGAGAVGYGVDKMVRDWPLLAHLVVDMGLTGLVYGVLGFAALCCWPPYAEAKRTVFAALNALSTRMLAGWKS